MKRIVTLFATLVVALATSAAHAAGFDSAGCVDHTGNWWNPAQNFMGVAIHQQGCKIQAEWFIYAGSSEPTWLSWSGDFGGSPEKNQIASPLYRLHGPQPMNYSAQLARLDTPAPGTMSITFSDACHASMQFQYSDPSGGPVQTGTLTLVPLLFGDAACIIPPGVKVTSPQAVPTGCIDGSMKCWSDAVTNSTVKFIGSPVKMVGLTGAQAPLAKRPIMFGYFINGGGTTATSGPNSMGVFYADTGEPLWPTSIYSGLYVQIDWAMGTDTGVLFHMSDGTCGQWKWFPPTPTGGGGAWSMISATCP